MKANCFLNHLSCAGIECSKNMEALVIFYKNIRDCYNNKKNYKVHKTNHANTIEMHRCA